MYQFFCTSEVLLPSAKEGKKKKKLNKAKLLHLQQPKVGCIKQNKQKKSWFISWDKKQKKASVV